MSNILPIPRMSLDRLSVVFDVVAARRDWLDEMLRDPAGCASRWGCELEVARGVVGYGRAALLRRNGETLRIDYDPYRSYVLKTAVSIETWRGRSGELVGDVSRWIDRDTGEVMEQFEPGRDLEPVASGGGEADPFDEYYIDREKLPYARLEGNPAKFPGFDSLVSMIGEGVCRKTGRDAPLSELMRPTRVDFAVDYPVGIDHFALTASRKQVGQRVGVDEQYKERSRSGRIQTMYFGSAAGDFIRVYDKVAEIASNAKISQKDLDKVAAACRAAGFADDWNGRPVTRVEALVRSIKTDAGKVKALREVGNMVNPFRGIKIASNLVIPDDADWQDKAVACWIRERGLDAALKEMPRQTRYRWMKRLGVRGQNKGKDTTYVFDGEPTPVPHPADVWEDQCRAALERAIPTLLQ